MRIASFARALRVQRRKCYRQMSTASTLSTYPSTQVSALPNGIRVASEKMDGETATVGVWIDAGSRFETPQSNGVAHFLEHMSFKGTGKRTRVQLEQEVENLGGHLNAYTSREQTVFYAKVNKEDVPQAMDILSDILTNSVYSEEAINAERDVILREMQEIEGQMEEVIFDRLHETSYRKTMLGETILGPVENIKNINRDQIIDYVNTHYVGPRMVVAGAGAVDHKNLVNLSEECFGSVPNKGKREPFKEPAAFTPSDIRIRYDDMPLAHVALSYPTAGWNDPDSTTLLVIQSLLGSFTKGQVGAAHSSSDLVSTLAKNDYASSMTPFNTNYSDTGLFGIYTVGHQYDQDNCMYHVTRVLTSLSYGIDELLLEEAKKQLIMSVLSQLDGSTATCEEIGRQMITHGRRIHPSEMVARIEAVDAAAVKNCANRFFYDRCHSMAAIGPIYELPEYDWIRRKSYYTMF